MSPTQERWREVLVLLDELIDADAAQREARLAAVRDADPDLAEDVAALFAREGAVAAEAFLEGSVVGPSADLTGRVIGHYTLERPLGHGGMGAVWLARRSDGRFEGAAAIKFLNFAMLARSGAERFEREGRLLARLAHPNIARLVDAGIESGQPYLVLEYVDGEPIDRWCDGRRLDVNGRIRLFLDVLAAVAHAHGQLVLHRDLKPANILVTGDGVVKLLDFGIAKLLDDADRPAPATELTAQAGRAFTPAYAAPEQVQGGDVTMATDVYALGVLLAELLTGAHPTATHGDAPVAQLRAVVDAEPARLSDAAARAAEAAAGQRSTTARQLARTLRGDLDNIAATALKKAPAERYQTVTALADDLRRYLRHEPVSARADSTAYRAARFVRRHRVGVAAAAAVVAALAGGVVATAWQAREAARQRELALQQLGRAETASRFVEQMLSSTWGPEERITRTEFLTRSEDLALRELGREPEQQLVVLQALASVYVSAGDYARAEPLARRAQELLPATADASWRASVECAYALDRWLTKRASDAADTLARWANDPRVEPGAAAQCAGNLTKLALNRNDAAGALTHALQAERLAASAVRLRPTDLASMHGDLGYAYSLNARGEDADREFAAALAIHTSLGQQASPRALAILNNWSTSAISGGDVPRGLALFEDVIRLAKLHSPGRPPPPYALANRAGALLALGRYDDAIAQADEARQVSRLAGNTVFEVSGLMSEAGARMERGELDAAAQVLDQAAPLLREIAADSAVAIIAGLRRSRLALLRDDPAGAAAHVAPVIALFESRGMRISTLCIALRLRAESASRLGRRDRALTDAADALTIAQKEQGQRRQSLQTGLSWLLVARLRHDGGDAAGARDAARHAVGQLAGMLADSHRDLQLARALAAT